MPMLLPWRDTPDRQEPEKPPSSTYGKGRIMGSLAQGSPVDMMKVRIRRPGREFEQALAPRLQRTRMRTWGRGVARLMTPSSLRSGRGRVPSRDFPGLRLARRHRRRLLLPRRGAAEKGLERRCRRGLQEGAPNCGPITPRPRRPGGGPVPGAGLAELVDASPVRDVLRAGFVAVGDWRVARIGTSAQSRPVYSLHANATLVALRPPLL